jgi:hypothetical protein
MDQSLKEVVRAEVMKYAKLGMNYRGYFTENPEVPVYSVVTITDQIGKFHANAMLIVRIVENLVIIERDQNDKVLVDALVQAGVPRSQIILAYIDEPVPAHAAWNA